MGELVQHRNETIHWKETLSKGGNPYALKPKPGMLTNSGEIILRSFRTPGRYGKANQETEWYNVHYDREYVTEWLLNHVVSAFPGITHVQLRELCTEALKLRKARLEGLRNGASETIRQSSEEASEDLS